MKKFLLATTLTLLLALSFLTVFLHTDKGKLMVVHALTERLEKQTGYSFTVQEWSYALPFRLSAKQVAVHFQGEEIATVESASLSLKPLALLNSKLILSDLSLEEVVCHALPEGKSSTFPTKHIEVKAFQVKRLRLSGWEETVDISGKATIDPDNATITSTLALNNTQIFSSLKLRGSELGLYMRMIEPANGHLTQTLSLPEHAPFACIVELSGDRAFLKDPTTIPLTGQVKLDYPNVEGSLALKGKLSQGFQLTDISATHKGITLNGELTIDPQGAIQAGTLTLANDTLRLQCSLAGSVFKPSFCGSIHHPTLGAASLFGTTDYVDQTLLADVKISSQQLGELGIKTALSTKEHWPLNARYQSETLQLEGEGNWRLSPESFMVCLESAEGTFLDYTVALKDPIILRDDEISPLLFQLDKGTVHVTLDSLTGEFHSKTKARNLPYSLVQKFLPELPITSAVSMDAHLYGDPAALQGHFQIELDEIQILDEMFSSIPALKASCRATLKDKSLECLGKIEGIGPDAVQLEARLPFSCTLKPPFLQNAQEETFFAKLSASGDIAPYLQLFYTDTTQIKGKTDIAIDITGPMQAPHIVGRAKLYDGSFESRDFGATFQNIEAAIEGEGSDLVLKELTATTEGNQTLSGSGKIHLSEKELFPFSIDLSLRHAPFLQLDTARIWTSGQLQITGTTKGSKVTGQLLVDTAEFSIPKQLSSGIHQVEVTYINQSQEETPPTPNKRQSPSWPMDLQVRLRTPGTTTIRGKDLNTTWKGEVLLTGEPGAVRLYGDLFAQEGSYMLNGQLFRIDQGTITLAGEFSRQASLNVIAYREINDYRAEMVLKGPMNNPGVTFQSDPPLAQQEVLSLILFNKPLPDISAHQGDQLKKTFSALATQGESPNFLGKMRDALGIDRIDITQNETVDVNEVSVRLGKYFYPGFYLYYNQSMPSDSKKVAVEANLMKNLKMEAELDDDINGQIMLKWKHDY